MLVDADPTGFGYFTAALIATTGIALASGVQFAVIGLWRRRESIHLSYAMLCLCLAGLALGNLLLRTAGSLAAATAALRWMIGMSVLSFPPFVAFIGSYTGATIPRSMKLLLGTLALLFLWLNGVMPATLFYTELMVAPGDVLPWGEHLFSITGTISIWGWLFHLASYALFLWALWCAWRQYRRGESMLAVLLGICLLVQFAALLWGDIAIDWLGVRSPYLDAFAFLPFVLLMSLSLAAQLRQRSMQLERARQDLEAEAHTRREAELSLRHIAYHDSLTGLPNRAHLLDRLAEWHADALAQGHHGALLLIDLDNFKTINDGLGHHVGDHLLQAIADRLLAVVQPGAVLARLGGDEFVLLLEPVQGTPDDMQARAQQVATDMIARLAEPVRVGSRVLAAGASVGVAVFPAGEQDVADLLRRADIALYRAKAAGRGTVRLFLPRMQQEAGTRLMLERGLRAALERGGMDAQFALHFQPQLSPQGELLGAEALLRWRHPQLGDLPPAEFIPMAEETGLIHALGNWVVGAACASIRAWDRDGVPFRGRLAVNVSAWQLVQPRLAALFEAQVRAAGIEPARLTLELTESALLQDFDSALETMQQLVAAGFNLALDDFGVGYSALSYLQRLPLDLLKIDRSFVSELTPEVARPLAGFIIDVAHRLGILAVAEGVETVPQRHALEQMGCDGLQGYLICRPLDDAGFRQWLAEHERAQSLKQA
ncbi:MAG TPA: EAL domain-containing protein [Rhodanobacter sp.]